MSTKIAVPIAAKNPEQAKQQIKAAIAEDAGILELRTDYLENVSADLVKNLIAEAKAAAPLPIIVTCRDKRQGGVIDYPVQLRIDILAEALKAGAEFIDFEYENFLSAENQERIHKALSKSPTGRLILSTHNFETKFPDIKKLHRDIQTSYPTAIPKLVYTARHINDCFDILDLLHHRKGDLIAFCMNEPGFITRVIAKKLGGFLTFASIDEKAATAPGQITIEQLKTTYRWDSINADTELYGVVGSPIAHSLGPVIHNACFAKASLNKVYLPLLVAGGQPEFDAFMDNILSRPWLGFSGLSVTIPHKENAIAYVKSKKGKVDPLVEKIGAANTIIIDESQDTTHEPRLSAYNTDYPAAMEAIISKLGSMANLQAAVIGAGGVARAIVAGLSNAGAKITIYNRTVDRAKKLAAEFDCKFAGFDDLSNLKADLIVNCTKIGMSPDNESTPLPKQLIKKDMTIFDTVYNLFTTALLADAEKTGAKTIEGTDMFARQAAHQFKLFTGRLEVWVLPFIQNIINESEDS